MLIGNESQSIEQNQLQIWNSFYREQEKKETKIFIDQDAYLSHFIYQTNFQEHSSLQSVENTKINEQMSKKLKNQEEYTENRTKKSIFHNFQKHLIITLKQQITKLLLKNQCQLIKSIWNIFLESNSFNKQILFAIFSKNKQKTSNNISKKYGFSRLKEVYNSSQISSAQQMLKTIILDHFRTNSIQKMLQRRRLDQQQKYQLIQYIKQFLFELENDNIQRRLPKISKNRMISFK